MHVNRVVPCAVVCDPFHGGWQTVDDLLVEYPNFFGGFVLAVDTYGACVFSFRLAVCQESRAVGSVDVLYTGVRQCFEKSYEVIAYDDLCNVP